MSLNTLTFGGVQTPNTFLVTKENPFDTASPRYEMVEVEGRNGDLVYWDGSFDNIEIKYVIKVKGAGNTIDARRKDVVDQITAYKVNVLSVAGYGKLVDTYMLPNTYREAIVKNISKTAYVNRMGTSAKFTVTFDCKPQVYFENESTKYGESILTKSGYYNRSGEFVSDSNYRCSEILEIDDETCIDYNVLALTPLAQIAGNVPIVLFDEDMNFLSEWYYGNTYKIVSHTEDPDQPYDWYYGGFNVFTVTATFPEAKYYAFSSLTTLIQPVPNIAFKLGSTAHARISHILRKTEFSRLPLYEFHLTFTSIPSGGVDMRDSVWNMDIYGYDDDGNEQFYALLKVKFNQYKTFKGSGTIIFYMDSETQMADVKKDGSLNVTPISGEGTFFDGGYQNPLMLPTGLNYVICNDLDYKGSVATNITFSEYAFADGRGYTI